MSSDPPETSTIDLRLDGPVARLTLDRPGVLNALSVDLLEELVEVCGWLAERDEVRVVVVSGAGRTFSAGADLSTWERLLADDGAARRAADAGHRAASAIESLPQVTIAAIHGRCVGGGVVLALACDLRFAADRARFSIPEVDIGIPLAWGGVPRLLREVGPAVARDLILTCRTFPADEALAVGLVSRVLPADDLDGEVTDVATAIAAKAPLPVTATLQAIAAEAGSGAPSGWSDADSLLVAVRDPACQQAAASYLAALRGAGRGGHDGD